LPSSIVIVLRSGWITRPDENAANASSIAGMRRSQVSSLATSASVRAFGRRVETIAQAKYSANPTLRNQADGNWLPRPVASQSVGLFSEDVGSPKERLGINISRDEKHVSACAGSDAGLRLGCLIPLLSRAAPASDRNRRPILRMPTRADDAPEVLLLNAANLLPIIRYEFDALLWRP